MADALNLSATTLERIEIFSRWVGFADPPSRVAKLTITPKDGRFIRVQSLIGQPDELPSEIVTQLLAALSLPAVPNLDPALFDLPEPVIRGHYDSVWTDDSPAHLARMTCTTGQVVTIRTEAQYAFMLPLKVTDTATGMDFETFDPRLSQALAALMPDGYLEKERLVGHLGMLERDLQEHTLREGRPVPDTPDDGPPNPEESQRLFDELLRISRGEESPEERAEAERTGKLSKRLLKRIPPNAVSELLARGADPSIADDVGQTALMHAAWPPFDRKRFRLLAQAGADLEASRNDGCTGLHLACAGGMADAAEEWVRVGADVQARTPEGATPLMLAAAWGNIVQLLLAAGADVNAADQDGHTAFVYAILKQSSLRAKEQRKAMRAMVKAGADVNRRDREGITPLGHARRVLARVQLEEEVIRAFNPITGSLLGWMWGERRMAEAVVKLIRAAGGRE